MKYSYPLLLISLSLLLSMSAWAVTNTANTSGTWETPGNWSQGHIPLATENVVVPASMAMTVNAADVCLSLTIAATGSVTINGANSLSIGGSFTNGGTFTAANSGSALTFNGAANSIISGGGTYTIAGTVVLNMGSAATSLDVQDANFISGINSGGNYYFTFTKGTFKMDNTGTLNDSYNSGSNSALSIPFGVVIESDKGTMNLCKNASTGNAILSGKIFMNGGILNVQTGQGENSGYDFQYTVNGGTPQLYLSSGTMYVGAGFNALTGSDYVDFEMSGGTLILAYNGYSNWITFQLADVVGGKTVMSGGTVILQDACNADIEDLDMGGANVAATLYSVTGGTVQFGYTGTQGSSTYYGVDAQASTNYPNFDFEAGTSKNVSAFNGGVLNVLSIYINTNMVFDASGFSIVNFEGSNGTFAFNHSGTFISPSSNTMSFTGSVNQVITGTVANPMGNLVINNTGGGVTLGDAETVSNNLTLTNGTITTTSVNSLTLEAGSTVSGGSASSYVNGPLNKIGNTAFVFPVGNSGTYAPIGMTAPATAGNEFTAQYYHSAYANTTSFTAPLVGVSTIEYWNLAQTGSDAITVTLYWQNAAASGILTFNNTLRVAYFNGSSWIDEGQAAITGASPGNITAATNSSNMGPFTFGTFNKVSNPLPITLLDFNAQLQEAGTVLTTWSTASEINNKQFIIEKTHDGVNYDTVTTVAGAGNSNTVKNYNATDETPFSGVSYYRLTQVDFDGHSTNTTVVPIYIASLGNTSIFPNPATTNVTANYGLASAGQVVLTIISAGTGQSLGAYTYMAQKGSNTFDINTAGIPSGNYILQLSGPNGVISQNKFIKE